MRWEYLQNIPCNRIDSLNADVLSAPLTMEELFESLKAMSVDKLPGEDGLSVEFYRSFWSEIRYLVFHSITYGFELG